MATREFEATTRLPTRPLSYANVDMAFNKELIVDYTNGNVYVKGEDGVVHDISTSIANIVIQSPALTDSLKVTYNNLDGSEVTVTINEAIVDLVAGIKANKEKLDQHDKVITSITSGSSSGGVTIIINPEDIQTYENHQFVTTTQLTEIANKISLDYKTVTLTTAGWSGSAAPYTQTVACSGLTADMHPTVDVVSTSGNYDNDSKASDAWCNIYGAVAAADSITFYASDKPDVNINVLVEIKKTGLTPAPSV